MSNNPVNQLLDFVTPPKKQKNPSNLALYAALWVANLIFLVLDVISGFSIYLITAWWLYGVLTALAGFVPLLLHEACFVRAYASGWQKFISIVGAVLAVFSVLLVGIVAGYVNVADVGVDVTTAEVISVSSLVLISGMHAMLFIVYFYIDPGIQSNQRTEQAVAMSIQKSKVISSAGYVLKHAEGALALKKELERQHGPQGAEALRAIVAQLMEDKDGDGIPDVLQGKRSQPTHQYNVEAEEPPIPYPQNGGRERPNE